MCFEAKPGVCNNHFKEGHFKEGNVEFWANHLSTIAVS